MSAGIHLTEVTQAVAPTPTLLASVHVDAWECLAMEFKNLDATQTLDITVKRRCSHTGDYSATAATDFLGILPGVTACASLEVWGSVDVQFWGVASGAGLNTRSAGLLRNSR
jgi:hypothetical protein